MTDVPLRLHLVLLPVWFALTCGLAVGVAGAGTAWAGALLLLVAAYPVALASAAVLSRAAARRGGAAAARRWRLLPLPWAVGIIGFLTWALSR